MAIAPETRYTSRTLLFGPSFVFFFVMQFGGWWGSSEQNRREAGAYFRDS